jgi:hypothetical protein
MIAFPLVIAGSATAALVLAAAFFFGGWRLREMTSTHRCGCGHAWGFADSFGRCTGKTRMRTYSYGRRLGWKWENCGCRKHVAPGMSPADLTGSERAFVEVPQ